MPVLITGAITDISSRSPLRPTPSAALPAESYADSYRSSVFARLAYIYAMRYPTRASRAAASSMERPS